MRWGIGLIKAVNKRNCLRFVQKRTLALSYDIAHGNEPTQTPLLMIHGLLGNKNNFNFVRRLLQAKLPHMTIISCDVRNHGSSPHSDEMDYRVMSEDTLELLHHLKIDKCFLLGHSLGGRIAMFTALTESSRIKKLIVVDVSPGVKGVQRGISKGPIKYMEAMKLVQFEPGMKRSEARSIAAQQLKESIPNKVIREFALTNLVETHTGSFGWRVNIDAVLRNADHIGYLGNEERFTPFSGDTLFLGGDSSDYLTSADFPDIKRLFPNSIIRHIPQCGHWVHADKPQSFTEHVVDFIAKN